MKTKFSSLLRVKKLESEKLQNQIIKLQNKKKSLEDELGTLKDELKNIIPPKNGTIIVLNKTFLQSSMQQENIELKKQNILFLEEQIKLTEQKYKEAMLEYEKIKHLHEIEVKKKIDEIKKAYKKLFLSNKPLGDSANELLQEYKDNQYVIKMAEFVLNTKRGIPYERKH